MSKLKIFCISHKYFKYLDNLDIKKIGSNGHKKKYPNNWLKDSIGKNNISHKNLNYGTLTSIYWIWKNKINNINNNDYIGICHYRRFWLKKNHSKKINLKNLNNNLLLKIDKKYKKFDAFLCAPIKLTDIKLSKILKKGKKDLFYDPAILFNKKKQTINLHFNMFHIYDGLIRSGQLLDKKNKSKFLDYIKKRTEFHPLSIFIIKKKFFKELCEDMFLWMKKCEKLFKKKDLRNYGEIRIFDFIAERFISFWITKNCKFKKWPYHLLKI